MLERTDLTADLSISRVLTGLWQVADQEKDGETSELSAAADALTAYAHDGFDTFDMADHYGSAELIAGEMLRRVPGAKAFTKWCPEPGAMTPEVVRAGVQDRLDRLGVTCVDLLQFHWWTFEHPGWLDALRELKALKDEGLIKALGVTNFDAAHLELALEEGIPLVSNQVSFSLIDRRAATALRDVCVARGVKLLAYGTLCGGFLTDRWLGQARPADIPDWSRMKYMRFIETAGGWDAFQAVLRAAGQIAKKHGVSISNVASRWVLEQPHVAGVIIGARLGEAEHRADNAKLFSFALDTEDHALLDAAFADTQMIPGDCGDEYRQPPSLTASGDLSHHLEKIDSVLDVKTDAQGRMRAYSGSKWEPIAGYCRAVREGNRITVSGTTATHGHDHDVAPGHAGAQTTYILDKIAASLTALGGSMQDVIRTRTYLVSEDDAEPVSRAHGRVFGAHPPANTTLMVAKLVGAFRVEIEAEAVVKDTLESKE